MNRLMIALAVFAVGLLPHATQADTWKDGPATAYVFGGDVESEGFGFGYQVAYEFNRNFSIEFMGLWHEDESDALSEALPTVGNTPPIGLDVITLGLTGRLSMEPAPSLLTYVGAGVGFYILEADNEGVRESLSGTGFGFAEIDGDKEFGAHIVLGCEVVLTKRWEVFAEYRYTFLDSGYTLSYSPDRDSPVGTERDAFDYDHGAIRIGVNYRL